jgi:hypothetical protein
LVASCRYSLMSSWWSFTIDLAKDLSKEAPDGYSVGNSAAIQRECPAGVPRAPSNSNGCKCGVSRMSIPAASRYQDFFLRTFSLHG